MLMYFFKSVRMWLRVNINIEDCASGDTFLILDVLPLLTSGEVDWFVCLVHLVIPKLDWFVHLLSSLSEPASREHTLCCFAGQASWTRKDTEVARLNQNKKERLARWKIRRGGMGQVFWYRNQDNGLLERTECDSCLDEKKCKK